MLMALRSLAESVEDILGGADVAVLVVDDFLPVNEREMVEDDFYSIEFSGSLNLIFEI